MNNSTGIKVNFFADAYLDLSTILLEFDGKRILIDPGLNQRKYSIDKMLARYDISKLNFIVITHYHGDHSNLTKKILARGEFKGRVICHKATADIMLSYFDIKRSPNWFDALDYEKPYPLFNNDTVTLYNAGHVLGSSIAYFKLGEKIVAVTGDLGSKHLPIVKEPHRKFSPHPIDLLIVDAKHAARLSDNDVNKVPFGDILYCKLNDCLMFDDGNILIQAPMIQIPMLIYCLNYIFNKKKYIDLSRKIKKVYLLPQQTLNELLRIFYYYRDLFDKQETEYVAQDDQPFSFNKLVQSFPREPYLRRSVIITSDRRKFINLFNQFKSSEKNDVLLLNNNIYNALQGNTRLIDKRCNIQIKRLPLLHYHPNLEELSDWCQEIITDIGIKRLIFYHYSHRDEMNRIISDFKKKIGTEIELVHQLDNNMVIV